MKVMKVKPTNPAHAAGLIDPDTKRSPFIDDKGRALGEAEVPESSHWVRRLIDREITLVVPPAAAATTDAPAEPVEPTGREPVTPLTTR